MTDAARENYGPRVYSLIYLQNLSLPCCHSLLFILFCNLQLSTIIYTLHLLANKESKGIDNALARVGCKCLFLCVQSLKTVVACYSYWFDKPWFLTEGNTYPHCTASPIPLHGKRNADHKHLCTVVF